LGLFEYPESNLRIILAQNRDTNVIMDLVARSIVIDWREESEKINLLKW